MEIELFKVYELNEYGKNILLTDKIFVAEKASLENYYTVIYKMNGENLEYSSFKLDFIKQIING